MIAKYVRWTEVFGYTFCSIIAAAILVCWFWKVDEIASEKDIGKTLVKPYEENVKARQECVVTKVLVSEWEQVKKDQPLLEVCEDTEYVRAYRIRQHRETFVQGMREVEKTGPLSPEILAEVAQAEEWIATWDAGPRLQGMRRLVTSPLRGEVTGTKDLEGKVMPADTVLVRVLNFRDLRLTVTLSGTNVERVRIGMPARIEIQPKYGKNANMRVDTRVGFWKRRRLQIIDTFEDEKVRNLLSEWWKDRDLLTKEDRRRKIALRGTTVNEAEVMLSARCRKVDPAREKTAPEAVKLRVDHLAGRKDLRGTVISGKHTATFQTTFLATEDRRNFRDYLWNRLGDRIGVIREKSGRRIPIELTELRNLRAIVKVKAELVGPDMEALEKEITGQTKPQDKRPVRRRSRDPQTGLELGPTFIPNWPQKYDKVNKLWESRIDTALEVEKVDRFFEGMVRMLNPPNELEDTVRSLIKQEPPAYLNAKVMAIVDKRRVAMLLFRQ